jgi:hypothetical protein
MELLEEYTFPENDEFLFIARRRRNLNCDRIYRLNRIRRKKGILHEPESPYDGKGISEVQFFNRARMPGAAAGKAPAATMADRFYASSL